MEAATATRQHTGAVAAGFRPPSTLERGLAAVLPGAALVAMALDGGAFDVVIRGEWGIAIWWVILLAFALGLLPRNRPSSATWLALLAFGALAAVTAASFGWSQSDERTSVELARVAMHAGVFALVASSLDRRTWIYGVAGLTAGAVVVVAVAVAARLFPAVFPDDLVAREFKTSRLSYPLNYWNAVGAWCSVTLCLLLAQSAHALRKGARAAALGAAPLTMTAAYLTYSRATLGGLALAVILVAVLGRERWVTLLHALVAAAGTGVVVLLIRGAKEIADGTGGAGAAPVAIGLAVAIAVSAAAAASTARLELRMPRRAARVTLGALAVIVLAVAVVRGPGVAERAWDQFTTPRAAATTSDPAERLGSLSGTRYLVWDTALDTGAEHPWEGTGAGTFEFAWNQAGRDPEHVRDGHSFWLEAWAELGIPGVLATLALAAALLWAAVRARVRVAEPGFGAAVGVLAALLLTAFHASLDWIWESTANTTLALALAAAAAASLSAPVLPRAAFAFRAAAGLAALVLVLVQLPPVVGTSRIRDSQAAAARGDDREALAAADDAVAIQPWAASPYVQRGLLLERAGALRAAEVDLRRAYRREPKDWRHPLLLARVLAEQGRARAAVEAFREARKLRPRSARLNPPPPTG